MTDDFTAALTLARAAGPEALQTLAQVHLPLVRALARRIHGGDLEEKYQQGVIGLMKALHSFDVSRGTTFSTYAAPLILGEIRSLLRQQTALHIPRTERELRRRIHSVEDTLTSTLHREPTVFELAEAMHMDTADLLLHMEDITVASIDAEEHAPLIPDTDDWQQRVELRDILSKLPPMDQQLILLRHRVGMTQAQAGQRLGMTQMQVSRREKIIRTLLKRALSE